MGLFRTSQGLGIPQICLVVGETGVKWTYFEGPDPRNDPIWGLKPRIWTSGDPKMDHFETTFGPLLARSIHFQGVESGPLRRENEGFGVFGVVHFSETPSSGNGSKKGPDPGLRRY